MSFKIRNTIVLAVVFVLITGGGLFYYLYMQPKQLKKTMAEIQKIEKELVDFPQTVSQVEELTNKLADTKRRYDSRSKEIPPFDITSQTYAYMSKGIDEAGFSNDNEFVQFKMTYAGSKDFGAYGYNIYQLTEGEAVFENLYKFVYFLENGSRLYKVAWVDMESKEDVNVDTKDTRKFLNFTMELHAYYTKIQELNSSLAAKSLTFTQSPFDPFDPIILGKISAEAPEDEVDIKNIEIKAILPGKAFVMIRSEMSVLHLGDKVWRGFVSRISPAEGRVEFTVNEGGIVRKVSKSIVFKKR
jgi:Tfp pilus assembly protein PilO